MFHALSSLFRRADASQGTAAASAARAPVPEQVPAAARTFAPGPAPAPAAACFHCGLPLPPGAPDQVMFEGAAHPVCCAACAAVAETVICNGYGGYYRERDRLAAPV